MAEYLIKKPSRIAYLYQKGKSLYYRLILPRNVIGLPPGKEIRVCLRTCSTREARKVITLLHAHVLQRITELNMAGCPDNPANMQEKAMKQLKDELDAKVDAILKRGNKVSLSQSEIKQRLLARLVKQIGFVGIKNRACLRLMLQTM